MYFLSAGRVNEHRSCSSNYCTTCHFKRRACAKVEFSYVFFSRLRRPSGWFHNVFLVDADLGVVVDWQLCCCALSFSRRSFLVCSSSVFHFVALFCSEQHREAKACTFPSTSFFIVVHCQCVPDSVHRTTFDLHINVTDEFWKYLKSWSSLPPQCHHRQGHHHSHQHYRFPYEYCHFVLTSLLSSLPSPLQRK